MNRFEYNHGVEDLGSILIENAFLNHFMPNAKGDYVKIYLLGLKNCYSHSSMQTSDVEIASVLGINEDDVDIAWKYWQEQGLIKINRLGSDKIIEYVSVSSLLFAKNSVKTNTKKPTKHKSAQITSMCKDVEKCIGRLLNPEEIETFMSWMDMYKLTPQTVALIIEDSVRLGKKHIRYWETMAKVFFDNNATTYDAATQYILTRDAKWTKYKEILKYLGITRAPSKPETRVIDKWLDEMNLSIDEIKSACDETIKINNPNIKYVDVILCKSPDSNSEQSQNVKKKKQSTSKPKKNTSMENDHNYNPDDLARALFGNSFKEEF